MATFKKKIKIAVSPSDQYRNLYAYGDTNEGYQMHRVAEKLVEHLVRCGVEVVYLPSGYLRDRVNKANAEKVDGYIAPHSNAFDGSVQGIRVHCYPSDKSRKFGKCIMAALDTVYDGFTKSKIVETASLYELKYPFAPAILPEIGFHDNVDDAKWIVNHVDQIAEALAEGICEYFKIPYVSRETVMYHVQVGAFEKRENAEKMLETVKQDYPDAFIKEVRT